MDDQHGILMDTLNELRRMIVRGTDRREICLQLERLIDFSQMHFQSEEQLLEIHSFPGADEHRNSHHALLSRLYSALEHINREEPIHFSSVLEFLPAWYQEHVVQIDQPYGHWLNEQGVY
jgi:hemerythrin